MRIHGPNGNVAVATAPATRRAQSAAFTLSEGEETRSPGAPAAMRTIGGIDALLALQSLEDPTERRKQAVKRGRLALDALDELKIGLLGGTMTEATLNKLRSIAGALKASSGDEGLDAVLGEIELRVEVELAKTVAR
jgi:hypothetical protein